MEMRKGATNAFGKDFYQLMNNAMFGKTMENIRIDLRLCSDAKKVDKLVAKPHFKDRTIFSKNLVAVQMQKARVLFNKSIYVGMSILDQSKTLIWIRTATPATYGARIFTET